MKVRVRSAFTKEIATVFKTYTLQAIRKVKVLSKLIITHLKKVNKMYHKPTYAI